MIKLSKAELIQRAAILCIHFTRNLAYYRAGWRNNALIKNDQFWITVNGNFIDICALEWCKLFGDNNGIHCWKKVSDDPDRFIEMLLKNISLSQDEFDDYVLKMRDYRDKFIAHLDKEKFACPPQMELALKSVYFYYDRIHKNIDTYTYPRDMETYYSSCINEAQQIYL